MKLKLDEQGNVVVIDGNPVYVHEDGKEVAFDAKLATQKIADLNRECKSHREAKEAAEKALKKFDGIDDADEAKKALQTLKNLDDQKLIGAGKVEQIKADMTKTYEQKLAEKDQIIAEKDNQLYREVIGGSFARSKFINEHVSAPVEMVQSFFGKHFSYEDGKIVAKDEHGNPIFSREKPGELASFDEAIEQIVNEYPYKVVC